MGRHDDLPERFLVQTGSADPVGSNPTPGSGSLVYAGGLVREHLQLSQIHKLSLDLTRLWRQLGQGLDNDCKLVHSVTQCPEQLFGMVLVVVSVSLATVAVR